MSRSIALFAFVPTLFLLFGVSATKPSKEIRPISSASVTHGDTRVTLLHIARTTSISNQYVRGNKEASGSLYPIPGVYVEFLIERLGKVAIDIDSGPNISSIEFWTGGKKAQSTQFVVAGGTGTVSQYKSATNQFGFDPPTVEDLDRACLRQSSQRGIILNGDKVEVRIQTGFDGKNKWFAFKDIPLF